MSFFQQNAVESAALCVVIWILLVRFSENLSEMIGDLFLPCDTPEAPKQGFFKNLFGGGTSNLDREELCESR